MTGVMEALILRAVQLAISGAISMSEVDLRARVLVQRMRDQGIVDRPPTEQEWAELTLAIDDDMAAIRLRAHSAHEFLRRST